MSILPSLFTPHLLDAPADIGFGPARGVGIEQRASLGRGLAFALLLATMSLASVYVPVVAGELHCAGGTIPGSGDTDAP